MHTTELSTKGGRRTYLTAGATGEINNNPRYFPYAMAKRSKRSYGMKKMEPAVETLYFRTATVPAAVGPDPGRTDFYIDLSQCTSLVNRRFYRQGINWAVGSMKLFTAGPSSLVVQKIPNTWVAFQAYKKAFDAWNKQQMDAIEEAGAESAVAAFRDFKIFADVGHVTSGFGNNLIPYDLQEPILQPYAVGEWEPSEIVVPNVDGISIAPAEYLLHMVGVNNNGGVSRGIIEGYADSRAFPQSPDPVSPTIGSGQNWLRDMFDVGNDSTQVTNNATDRNDELPYPQVNYPGGEIQAPTLQLHAIATTTGTTVGGMTQIKGGTFPCGLIKLSISNNDSIARSYAVTIDLIPGTHRGYMCEKMLEA